MRAYEFITESTTTLNKLYNGNFPDRDESFWDEVRPHEFDNELEVKVLPKYKLTIMLQGQYRVEHLDEILDMMSEDQQEILQRYMNDPTLSNKTIVISGDRIIDGNHRALAAAMKGVPINYVDLADLDQQDVTEDTGTKLDPDYFMNEGCGIYAVALALNEPGSQIYVISNKNGESWSKSFPYEITHVFVNVPGQGQYDIRGKRSPEVMASDFRLTKSDYSINGPFDPKEFFKKFMGNSDTKPLYGTIKDVKQVQGQLKDALYEIKYSNSISDSSNIINALVPNNSTKLGVVDHHTVYRLDASDCYVYYLYDDKKSIPLSYIITEKTKDNDYYPFRQAEKLVDTPGAAMALLQFLRHYGIKLLVRSDEPMTLKGITWLTKMIDNPRGLNIHDGSGQPVNLQRLWDEWYKSLDDYNHKGVVSIFIESKTKPTNDYCFEDQSNHRGLLKNPLRFIGDVELY